VDIRRHDARSPAGGADLSADVALNEPMTLALEKAFDPVMQGMSALGLR
jgi:hypothetical protein